MWLRALLFILIAGFHAEGKHRERAELGWNKPKCSMGRSGELGWRMARRGVAGEGRGQVVPVARNTSPGRSMACPIRISDHHMSLDYFVPFFLFSIPSLLPAEHTASHPSIQMLGQSDVR